jgi:uncharacterized repeat protein (TIGR02543 family)
MRIRSLNFLIFYFLMAFQIDSFGDTIPPIYEIQTNLGTITVLLDTDNAPITSTNFFNYVKKGFYTNTLFHRTIKNFVIQGGGFDRLSGQQKTTEPAIANEASNGLKNVAGSLAMARTNDPNSATSQFFINLSTNSFLDYKDAQSPGYAVFGHVIEGLAIINKIGNLSTYGELPFSTAAQLVYIEKIYTSSVVDSDVSKTRILINGLGTVTSLPAGINCGKKCYSALAKNKGNLTLKANANPGYTFNGWQGDCQGGNATITLILSNGNHNCTATFLKDTAEF